MSILLLLIQVLGAALTVNALMPRGGGWGPRWVPALVTSELAPLQGFVQASLAVLWLVGGWAGGWAGSSALVIAALSVGGLVVLIIRSFRSRAPIATATTALGVGRTSLRRLPLLPRKPIPGARDLSIEQGIPYGSHPRQAMDVIRLPGTISGPVLLQIHGGGWWRGNRDRQARPLMFHMARKGWVVIAVGYRVSPDATFPDHLIDIKAAIAWIRSHAEDLAADASFLAVTGGSAGGQLAALVGLTAGMSELQPGFEDADTSVQACVPLYGVHELLADGAPLWPYLETSIMKVSPAVDPGRWKLASPERMATAVRPPFFIAHGQDDTLVGPDTSMRLAYALRAAGGPAVAYVEVPWARHGFDYFDSIRSRALVDAITHALTELHRRQEGE